MTLFIDPEYLKNNTFLNGSIEDGYLRPAMKIAQDKWIKPYLGDSLHDKLVSDINSSSLTGAYQTLVNTYIRPALAWWTVYEYLPNAFTKIDNSGLVQRISDDTSPSDQSDLYRLREQAKDTADYYLHVMYDYLCANTASFSEYLDNTWPERHPISYQFTRSGMTVSKGHGREVNRIPYNWIYR